MTDMYDIFDEEFNRHLMLAKTLVSQLKKKKDRSICTKWIQKLCDLQANDPTVKKNRNHFFRYMLRVINKGLDEEPEQHFGFPQYDDRYKQRQEQTFMNRWSADKRTYVAVKPLPGKGALVYMAVSKDPSLGWEYPTKYK